MTFRDFLHTLFEKLRDLWRASFSSTNPSSDSAAATPDLSPEPPEAGTHKLAASAPVPSPSVAAAQPVRTLAAEAGSYAGEVSISLRDHTDEAAGLSISEASETTPAFQADDSPAIAEKPSAPEDSDHVSPNEGTTEPADAALAEGAPDDVTEGEENPPMVQAPLEISAEDDPLPADIMVESYGRRMGLSQLIESLLFVSDEPVDSVQLAKALSVSLDAVEASVQRLVRLYQLTDRGLRLQTREGRHSLVTAPESAGAIEDFLNLDLTTKLSGPALETLAVIAYRQPVTRIQIEAVRGVDCSGVLRSMTQRGLIEEVGRLETVGRPILYGVTDLFMQHFGLLNLDELPPLTTEDEDMLWAATQLAELEGEVGIEVGITEAPDDAADTESAPSVESEGAESEPDAGSG
jgi:segregation and condensation protein B